MLSKIFMQSIIYQNQFPFSSYIVFIFFFLKLLLGIYFNIHGFLQECSQHIPPGVSSYMWLLKFVMLWHRRFLSALINALFQLQMLQQRTSKLTTKAAGSPTSPVKSAVCIGKGWEAWLN